MKIKDNSFLHSGGLCRSGCDWARLPPPRCRGIPDLIYVKRRYRSQIPAAGIYEQYSPYEIGISGDGQSLLYKTRK